jgi:GMP synthase (glutamine-hydrolysing)
MNRPEFDFSTSEAIGRIVDEQITDLQNTIGSDRVILALSGGVDSSVVAALLHRAIGNQLTCIFVDHGMMRKGEPSQIEEVFCNQFGIDLIHLNEEDRYLELLKGVTDPEQKRTIIGSEFWKVFFEQAEKLDGVKWLAQGTIFPDLVESGADGTNHVKSHHNVIPFPDGVHFDLIEPIRYFYKDEVRKIGSYLGLPDHIVQRQPFPGPGLGVRVIGGELTKEKLDMLREADVIVREEIKAWDTEGTVWQYFCVLPDVQCTGTTDGKRTYAHPVIIRAVSSTNAMTADVAQLPYELLGRMATRIVAEVDGVNRVAYDVTPKPPGTIEWE